MTLTPDADGHYRSTRWVPAGERMSSSARGKRQQLRSSFRWFGLPHVRSGEWVTLRVKYTQGAECWYYVEARGRRGAFVGITCLHDVMREIRQA